MSHSGTGQDRRDGVGKVVVVGSLNMDLVFRVARAPEGGETVIGQSFATVPGGKGANQAIACARMGASVAMVGRVGADGFGGELLRAMAADGVDASHVAQDEAAPSGVAMVMVDDAAQNRIVVAPGANFTLTPELLEAARDAIAAAGLLVMQLEAPLATVCRAAEIARAAGVAVLLNPAPAQTLPDALYGLVDYLIPNESEASALTGIEVTDVASAGEAARVLLGRGAANVLITLGAQGVLIANAAGEFHLRANKVRAIDTTAAGDTFIGGFSAGLLEGLAIEKAAEIGQKAASICVSRRGAQPSIPYRREL